MNQNLEKIRRRGALIVAAIEGDKALAKFVAGNGLIDHSEIAEAKAEAAQYVADARAKVAKYFADLDDLEKRIRQIEINDRNARLGRPVRRHQNETDLAASAIFAERLHKNR